MATFLRGHGSTSKKPKTLDSKSRFSSVDSDSEQSCRSKSSFGSQNATTDLSTISTAVSQIAEEDFSQTKTRSLTTNPTGPHSLDQGSSKASSVRTQRPHDLLIPAAPMFLLCLKGAPQPYDVYEPPPFVSIGKSLDPFRTMFQSAHPATSIEELKFYASRYFGTRALGKQWIPTALSYPHTFLGTLCVASAYHDVVQERSLESVQTIAIRQEVIHLVGRNMVDPDARVSDHNIMAVIQLILSEVIGREESGLSWHEEGIQTMIKQRGGLEKLGVDGCLASSISWVSLATAVLREAPSRILYTEYCMANSTRQYPPNATLPESPIYCPRPAWRTILRSTKCTSEAQNLLGDIRMMIDLFLETRSDQRNDPTLRDIYEKIIDPVMYQPIGEIRKLRLLTQHDYKYEAIRIASIIQAEAIVRHVPLSDALTYATEVQITPASSSISTFPVSIYDKISDTLASKEVTPPSPRTHATSPVVSQPLSVYSSSRPSESSLNVSEPHMLYSEELPSGSSKKSPSLDYTYFPAPPATAPSNTTKLLKDLRTTIEHSNISACWSDMAGVLLWISLVVGAASNKSESRLHKKYYSALTMRVGVMLCFEHREAINSTMVRMCEIIKVLGGENQETSVDDEKGKGKKRRT
jgi:hypothetical protein